MSRPVRLLAILGLTGVIVLSSATAAPAINPTAITPVVRQAGGLPCLPVIGCDPAGSLVGDGAKAVAQAVFDQVSSWIATGTATLLDRVADAITRTTSVDLTGTWFTKQFGVMRTMAAFVLLPMLLVAAVSAIIRQDPGRLLRAVVVYLPLAVLGTAVALELVDRALQVSDILSDQVASSLGTNTHSALAGMSHAIVALPASGPSSAGFVLTIGALLLAFGALLVWIELLVRASAIYVAVFFLPLVLSGLLWPATARWSKRLVELLVSLILSKFVIVAVLSLAVGALASGDPLNGVLAGAALLLLAAFAPFVLLRLVPLVEAGVIGHLEGIERRPVALGTAATTQAVSLALGASGSRSRDGADKFAKESEPLSAVHGGPLPPAPNPSVPTDGGKGQHQRADDRPLAETPTPPNGAAG